MNNDVLTLPDDPEFLKIRLHKSVETIKEKDRRIRLLEEQLRLAKHKTYGKQSEKDDRQEDLFDEAEATDHAQPAEATDHAQPAEATDHAQPAEAPAKEQITYTRNKPKRQPLPDHLPREVIVHDIDDADKTCDCCGGERHRMGEDRSEQLEYIPAKLKIIEHVRPKYSCRTCEKAETSVSIKQAPVLPSPIPKSYATASLLSAVITHKFAYSLPLYRQERLFGKMGIDLSRQTLSHWLIQSAALLTPVVDRLHERLLEQSVIHADETPVKVINEDKAQCYMWIYCTGTDSPTIESRNGEKPNIVLFDYQPSRAAACPMDYLQGYNGYLQVDGYAAYERTQATLVGCWAHARRKFKEADIAKKSKNSVSRAAWAINHIQKLYRIEKQIKDLSDTEKYHARQTQSVPLLTQFKQWLDKSAQQVLPKTALGKAVHYCIRQWPKLIRYVDDGKLMIDNNRPEREAKAFAIGRKNWLFANTGNGAKASCCLYSIVRTAIANGVDPQAYIAHLLNQLCRRTPNESVEDLLPWNVKL